MDIYDKAFDIEHLFVQYLERSKQTTIKGQQLIETRRAFMAGLSSLLLLQVNEMSELTEDDAVEVLDRFKNQLERFWIKEANESGG